MDLVDDNLWLGTWLAAQNLDSLKTNRITHIVSVLDKPLAPHANHEDIFRLFIQAHDVSSEDLFSSFDKAFHFIENGTSNGTVLVHCVAGISRSTTIVLSYLIKKYNISTEAALERVQKARPSAKPNTGFMAQLKLHEILLNQKETNSIVSRWYRLQHISENPPEGWETAHELAGNALLDSNHLTALKCRKCRLPLAKYSDIVDHRPGEGANWKDPSWIKFVLNNKLGTGSCRLAYFVVPLSWMQLGSTPEGKLHCIKCHSKVGAFCWKQPVRCPCRASFLPGFYLSGSRVDVVKYRI